MKFREACLRLTRAGFILDRVRGSHYIFKKGEKEVIIPKHSRDVATFVIRQIDKAVKEVYEEK
jgi:predicted RNA binding protein YcfA (HicA-like mRNA interferase family)